MSKDSRFFGPPRPFLPPPPVPFIPVIPVLPVQQVVPTYPVSPAHVVQPAVSPTNAPISPAYQPPSHPGAVSPATQAACPPNQSLNDVVYPAQNYVKDYYKEYEIKHIHPITIEHKHHNVYIHKHQYPVKETTTCEHVNKVVEEPKPKIMD
ncbi:CotD family spore coat protein [Fictibacillus sp. Mic-4]|uniref:CotD family spore coat protein n=1 Tax=Fictibacillus TaxID=1329200 RepID=UPI000417290D|nr:CotD family spore coat protein [Fictibacillus gelatini]